MKKVFVNGSFDLLHPGHLELLQFASSQGDYLLVAIDSDSRIKSRKGSSRPINSLKVRLALMSSIRWVDEVTSFASDEELSSIVKTYEPDIMIVGADWKDKPVIGSQYSKQLIFFDRKLNYSTTDTLNSYLSRLRETPNE